MPESLQNLLSNHWDLFLVQCQLAFRLQAAGIAETE